MVSNLRIKSGNFENTVKLMLDDKYSKYNCPFAILIKMTRIKLKSINLVYLPSALVTKFPFFSLNFYLFFHQKKCVD